MICYKMMWIRIRFRDVLMNEFFVIVYCDIKICLNIVGERGVNKVVRFYIM